jgi:hypothetical protein
MRVACFHESQTSAPRILWRTPRLHYKLAKLTGTLFRGKVEEIKASENRSQERVVVLAMIGLGWEQPEGLRLLLILKQSFNVIVATDNCEFAHAASHAAGARILLVADPEDICMVYAEKIAHTTNRRNKPDNWPPIVAPPSSIPALQKLRRHHVPLVVYVTEHERLPSNQEFDCRTVDAVYAMDPGLALSKSHDAKEASPESFSCSIDSLLQRVSTEKQQTRADRDLIISLNALDVGFSYPNEKNNLPLAAEYYLEGWRTNLHRRKPFAGFHPGIYRDCHPALSEDPFAHFLRADKPSGPWSARVISNGASKKVPKSFLDRCALHVHLHFTELAGDIFRRLSTSDAVVDLFITTTSNDNKDILENTLKGYSLPVRGLEVVPNCGRDIGPLLTAVAPICRERYEVIGHIHAKKSPHLSSPEAGSRWMEFSMENLIGGKKPMLSAILAAFYAEKDLGLVFPDDPNVSLWGPNFPAAQDLFRRMKISPPDPQRHFDFPIGNMFWVRTDALTPLLDLNLEWADYPPEPLASNDGTILHALERIVPFVARARGYRHALTHVPGFTR